MFLTVRLEDDSKESSLSELMHLCNFWVSQMLPSILYKKYIYSHTSRKKKKKNRKKWMYKALFSVWSFWLSLKLLERELKPNVLLIHVLCARS